MALQKPTVVLQFFPKIIFAPDFSTPSSSKAGMFRPQCLLSAAPFLSFFFPALYRPPFIQVIAICSGRGSFFICSTTTSQLLFLWLFFPIAFHFFLSFASSSVFSHFLNTLFLRGLTSLNQRISCILHWAAGNHLQLAEKSSCIIVQLQPFITKAHQLPKPQQDHPMHSPPGLWFKYS